MLLRTVFALRPALAALVLVGTAAGCGSDRAAGPNADGLIDITNASTVSVWSVRVRPCGTQEWGPDLLQADIIPPTLGQSFPVEAGCFDVRLVADPATPGERIWTNVDVSSGETESRTVTSWGTP